MERKITKLLVLTGIVMAGAASMVPLTSYAAVSSIYGCSGTTGDNACANDSGTSQVSVNVGTVLELDATGTKMEGVIPAYPGLVRTGNLDVKVRSAKPYTISISAEDPALTNSENDSIIIRSRDDIASQDKSGWGIKKKVNATTDAATYSAITTSDAVFFTGTPTDTVADRDSKNFVTTKFDVGVKAGSEIPQGTYATTITVIAATKE